MTMTLKTLEKIQAVKAKKRSKFYTKSTYNNVQKVLTAKAKKTKIYNRPIAVNSTNEPRMIQDLYHFKNHHIKTTGAFNVSMKARKLLADPRYAHLRQKYGY